MKKPMTRGIPLVDGEYERKNRRRGDSLTVGELYERTDDEGYSPRRLQIQMKEATMRGIPLTVGKQGAPLPLHRKKEQNTTARVRILAVVQNKTN
jgi:hypothetical protein